MAASAGCHVAILLALLWAQPQPAKEFDPRPVTVTLVAPPRPAPLPLAPPAPARAAAAQPSPAKPSPVKPPPPRRHVARSPPPDVEPLPATAREAPAAAWGPGLSAGQLAGASSADSGPPGGACDMARWLQRALRRDSLVQTAVAGAGGKAIMVWNGDWVRNNSEDGRGLAAVREAIMWEVAFAPAACKAEPVHGLVLISLGARPGAARLAVGSGEWRWSDLLTARAADASEEAPGR
jgi:hypothetical protein